MKAKLMNYREDLGPLHYINILPGAHPINKI